jgi:hypothetical protein
MLGALRKSYTNFMLEFWFANLIYGLDVIYFQKFPNLVHGFQLKTSFF